MFRGTIHYHLGTERGKPSIIISVNALHFRSALCHVNLISIDGTLFQTGIPLWFYISMFLFKALSVTSLLPYPWRCCLSQIRDECCCSLVLTSGNFLFSLSFFFIEMCDRLLAVPICTPNFISLTWIVTYHPAEKDYTQGQQERFTLVVSYQTAIIM